MDKLKEKKDIIETRLDELAKRRVDQKWNNIRNLIIGYYGDSFFHDVFSKAELFNSSGKNSNYEKMIELEKDKTRSEFFEKIQSIEYFLDTWK